MTEPPTLPQPAAAPRDPQAPPPAAASPTQTAPAQARPATSTCPSCGEVVWPSDNFCEACRAELAPALFSGASPDLPTQCLTCPDARITAEGYCESCGRKVPVGSDHCELKLDLVAGVTDRGLRHTRNEDAMALATARSPDGEQVALAVVCDGVSTSSRPDEASHQATKAAMHVLLSAVRMAADLPMASAEAFMAARDALITMASDGGTAGNAPSATFVSAVVTGRDVTICWLGDSRAYWLDARSSAEARQLSRDDSVAQELVKRGLLSEPDALASPAGHVVTGWLGADLRDAEPHVTTFEPDGPGVVLICSDGLWNYQPEAAELASMALPTALTDPLGAAAALVEFALGAGGSDNITVVLAPFRAFDHPAAQATVVQATPSQSAAATITVPLPVLQVAAPAEPAAPAPDAAAPQTAFPQIEENPADEPG